MTKINWQNLLRKAGLILLVLFYLSCFTSKTGIDITGGLLLLMALVCIIFFKRDIIKNNGFLLILLLPYLIGFLLSFFSLDGFNAALNFLNRHRFILILIPLTTFIKNDKDLNYIFAAVEISALAGALYGIYQMYIIGESIYDFKSFLAIGRFADMLVVVILINIVFLFKPVLAETKKELILKRANIVLTSLFIFSLLLTCQRGSWLGFFFAITAFALVYKRKLLVLILIAILFIVVVPYGNFFKKELVSITDTKTCVSNVARLHLWKVGLDFSKGYLFFGTGVKNVDEPLKRFFLSKPGEYQERYKYAAKYYGNLHNSYLQILVESGIFYFASYFISLFFILIQISKNMKKVKTNEKRYITIAFISTVGFLISQFFHGELFSYGVNIYYMTLFSACFVANK